MRRGFFIRLANLESGEMVFQSLLVFFPIRERRRQAAGRMLLVVVVLIMVLFIALVIVPVVVSVPVVVMFTPTSTAFPVTCIEPLSIVIRLHPSSLYVRWPSPITFMPLVMLSPRIPIPGYPYKLGAWGWRQNVDHIRRRRRAN